MANRVLLEKEIKEYCQLNGITDVAGFITQCMLQGFNIFKYGTSPKDNIERQNGSQKVSNRSRKPAQKLIEKPVEEKPVEEDKPKVTRRKIQVTKK